MVGVRLKRKKARLPGPLRSALSLSGVYLFTAGLWIIGSDTLAEHIFSPASLTRIQTWKGWFFVTVTASLLGLFVYRQLHILSGAFTRLEGLLEEKEVLTRELHHRIKNNLQLVSSLLSLEKGETDDPAFRERLNNLERKIITMGIIHEISYFNRDMSRIPVSTFLERLLTTVRFSGKQIGYNQEADEELLLPVDSLVPLGLLTEEILNHLPVSSEEDIRVGFAAGNDRERYTLVIRSSGTIDMEGALSGRLVEALTAQLRGEFRILDESGRPGGLVFEFPGRQ